MSRLHTVMATAAEVAKHFGADPATTLAVPPETVEGGLGLVVIERDRQRSLRLMRWGFPRLTREMVDRGEPPGRIGLVADLTNPLWEQTVVDPRYRCIIAITHFANPEGATGAKTRTWFSVDDQPIAAWAGFCRNTPEFGPVYAGMTMTANAAVLPTNDRMPVLLAPGEYDAWLRGSIRDVIGFQFREPIPSERVIVERTNGKWRAGGLPSGAPPQLALL